MTLFTIIWGIITLLAFIQKGMKHITYVTLLFMTFQCANVIQTETISVGPQIISSIIYIFKYWITCNGKIKVIKKREFKIIDICLIAMLFIIAYSSIVNGTAEEKKLKILQILIYIYCYWCIRRTTNTFSEEEIYKMVRNIIVIVVGIGIIQVLTTTGFLPFRNILKVLLYNEDNTNIYFNLNDDFHNKRIYAMFMEPSYLASILVGGFYYLFSYKDKIKSNILLMSVILIEIILTTSSTAYGAFIIIGLLFIIYSKQLPLFGKIIIVFGVFFGGIVLYFGFYDLLDKVIFSKLSSGSGITRTRWNNEAFEAYKSSPIYGVGYKNIRGSSIFFSLLGEVGIIGFVLYTVIIVTSVYKIFLKNKNQNINIGYFGSMYAVLSATICQLIACPDFDMCSFWFWMYILSIYERNYALNSEKEKIEDIK